SLGRGPTSDTSSARQPDAGNADSDTAPSGCQTTLRAVSAAPVPSRWVAAGGVALARVDCRAPRLAAVSAVARQDRRGPAPAVIRSLPPAPASAACSGTPYRAAYRWAAGAARLRTVSLTTLSGSRPDGQQSVAG